MVGMNQRFRPDAAALKTFVSGGELGEVYYLRAGWLNRRAARARRTWRQRKAGAGGGALMDLGIQMLDLSLWILDFPAARRGSPPHSTAAPAARSRTPRSSSSTSTGGASSTSR